VYDALGRLTKTYTNWSPPAQPGGPESYTALDQRTHDAADNLRTETHTAAGSADGSIGWQSVTDEYTYDVLNRQIQAQQAVSSTGFSVNPNSPVVTYTKYDALGRVMWEFDANGNATGYTYSSFGEVLEVREGGSIGPGNDNYPENRPPVNYLRYTDYTYDDAGRVLTETQDLFTRDGQYAQVTPPRVTTAYGYDELGRKISMTEAKGAGAPYERTTRYIHDADDHLIATIEPLMIKGKGDLTADSSGALQLNYPLAVHRTTLNQYDVLGRLVSVTEDYGAEGWARTTRMGYDAADNLLWTAEPQAYDSLSDPAWPADPLTVSTKRATVTVNTYDALNRRTSTTEAANATKVSVTTPNGTSYTYPDLGYAPPVTQWVYDEVGRVVQQISPADASDPTTLLTTKNSYDTSDRLITVTEGRTNVTSKVFTAIRQTTFDYDGFGHVVDQVAGYLYSSPGATDPNGQFQQLQETRFTYDALGLLRDKIEVLQPAGVDPKTGKPTPELSRVTHSDYDANGNLVLQAVARSDTPNIDQPTQQSEADFLNTRRTGYTYDRLDRLVTETDAWAPAAPIAGDKTGRTYQDAVKANLGGYASPVTSYKYDAADHVIEVTDPRGVKTHDAVRRTRAEDI
jgi:YD repeat-containing protein